MATSTIAATDNKPRALNKEDVGKLFSTRQLYIGKIFLSNPGDLQQIESTGVIVQTREPDYVVILGDRERADKLRSMGFSLQEPVETDHKRRKFRALIRNVGELKRLHTIVSDVWPDHWPEDTKFPLHVSGRAYDSEFKWAREAGLNIELCQER